MFREGSMALEALLFAAIGAAIAWWMLARRARVAQLASDAEALRRSQALLSHLIDTSPDCITLTELATGRYVLVNKCFERLTGWSLAEVVGRTAGDIGIWHDAAHRDRLVGAVREHGRADEMPSV